MTVTAGVTLRRASMADVAVQAGVPQLPALNADLSCKRPEPTA